MTDCAKSIVVIDDERTFDPGSAGESILYIRNSEEALSFLVRLWIDQYDRGAPDLEELWLDHDLGGFDTIMPVVRFLSLCLRVKAPLGVGRIMVHTMNPTAKQNIVRDLQGYDAQPCPLPALIYS